MSRLIVIAKGLGGISQHGRSPLVSDFPQKIMTQFTFKS